ncbi:hypothetical protein RN001_011816 [Aquatica leii]|uniref:DUF4806 domain-containing protein n=1 Tax=Aquatica leii TaxID=1421715 RepID=A0AAN7P244_9COLE|nr:hypothetical protein RN001_011816 [Aquatica leii]
MEEKRKYSVVHFTDEGNVSVVPTSWILEIENGDNDKYECWWPKKNVRKAIQLASRPSTHWDLFAVDVLGVYDTYEMGLKYERKWIKESDASESDNHVGRGQRRKFRKNFSNEESETESDCLEVENIVEELLVEDDLINRAEIVEEIHRKQCEMDQVLQIFSERLLNVEVKLPATMHSALNNTGNDLLPKKQFSTVEELQEFENNFSEETNKQLICHLKLCGGRDFKDAIKRYLKLLFSNSLARICSWTGQKHHYKVKDMKIMRVIKEAVSSSFNVNTSDIEVVIMDWFRYAAQREKREQ